MQNDDWSPPPDGLEFAPHQVDIWRISLDPSTGSPEKHWDLAGRRLRPASVKLAGTCLSADEAERAARFHFPADRDRFILAHGHLRRILARYVRCEPHQL
ncbi:MAG: hypothetical protein AB1649_27380, partial [Chloroflexota bacterium]